MPIKKHSKDSAGNDITLPTFSYQNDRLADLIVAAWRNEQFPVNGVNHALGTALTDRKNGVPSPLAQAAARAAVNFFAGMDLASAVVITEQEHDNGFTMQDDDQVVFVLPRDSRVTGLPGQSHSPDLLETAKLLMSCTPNGI